MITWKLEQRNIKDLKKHSKNPRKLTTEQYNHLKKSIDKFGLIDKPIINLDNTIIGGHQRIEILKKDKIKEVECHIPDHMLTQEEIDELNIRLNRNTGEWDWDILANEWEVSDLLDWGFTEEEFTGIDSTQIEPEEDSEVLEPAKDEDAYTKLGDIYDLNNHRIVCGDSKNIDNWNHFPECEITFTSPPYNLGKNAKLRGHLASGNDNLYDEYNDNSDDESYLNLNSIVIANSMIKSNYQFINLQFLAGNKKSIIELINIYKNHFADILFWNKTQVQPAMAENVVNSSTECIFIFSSEKDPNRNIKTATFSRGTFNNFIQTKSNSSNEFSDKHKGGFPLEFAFQIVKNFCNKSVIDPFMGTGTTLIAAEQLNRICYGIELSPAYCDIIIKRWIKWMQKNNRAIIIKKNGTEISIDEVMNGGKT